MFRQLLILIICLMFSFIFWNLLQRRTILLRDDGEEGFNSLKKNNGLTNKCLTNMKTIVSGEIPTKIDNVLKAHETLELCQFCIKGSINSAYDGTCNQPIMAKYVISRGCRFLDFEVYDLKTKKKGEHSVVVGFNEKPDAIAPSSKQNVQLKKLLKEIIPFAFSNQRFVIDKRNKNGRIYNCPNINDPLFIRLRMKTNDKMSLYKNINQIINELHCDQKYKKHFKVLSKEEKINANTMIKTLFQKIVFVFQFDDKINNENANFYNNLLIVKPCGNSKTDEPNKNNNFATLIVGAGDLEERKYSDVEVEPSKLPVIVDTNKIETDKIFMVVPDNDLSSGTNPATFKGLQKHGFQIHMMKYYKKDQNLNFNEVLHNVLGHSFVPMATVIRHLNSSLSNNA